MRKPVKPALLASTLVMGLSLVGCSSANVEHRPVASAAQAPNMAPRVEAALAHKDYARALQQAEELVTTAPRKADYRVLLGRAYLANGRYVSAREAFTDAMTLGSRAPRTIISLALCESGLGDVAQARALLDEHRADLPAADYGLAMTMAGAPREGVRALVEAVHQPDATAQTRQNLAYALAMAGAWGQARLIAGQDLPARTAEQRIGEWSKLAMTGNEPTRVAAFVGIAPSPDDTGLPQRLALNASAPSADSPKAETPARLASAGDLINAARRDVGPQPVEAAPEPAPAVATTPTVNMVTQPVAVMAANEVTERVATMAVNPTPDKVMPAVSTVAVAPPPPQLSELAVHQPASMPAANTTQIAPAAVAIAFQRNTAVSAPFVHSPEASATPIQQAVQTAFHERASTVGTVSGQSSTRHFVGSLAPAADAQASNWVVQLGAYDSKAVALDKWQRMQKHRKALRDFHAINSTLVLKGRTFHRLAIRGFAAQTAAVKTCRLLKTDGQRCFVRHDDTNITRMARAAARKQIEQAAANKPKASGGSQQQIALR